LECVLYEVEAEVKEEGDDQILQLSMIDCKYPPQLWDWYKKIFCCVCGTNYELLQTCR